MTSRTGRKRTAASDAAAARPRHRSRRRAGFTLVELVLALLILVLLSGALIASFHGSLASVRIEENVSRMVSMLKTARADAALTGRRLQVTFDPDTTQPVVSIETDPLAEPNVFKPYLAWWAQRLRLTGDVRVLVCELTGASSFMERTAEGGSAQGEVVEGAEGVLSPVTFTPDGGSDSLRMVLGLADEDIPWTVEITLNGADGTVKTRRLDLLTEEELLEEEQAGETRG